MRVPVLFLLAGLFPAAAATGAESLPGPVPAEDIVDVIDGDTLNLRARVWLGMRVETLVRVAGVDAPEMRGHCEAERRAARRARQRLAALVRQGVVLRDVTHGKYAGRVVARVLLPDGRDVARVLIDEGLGRPYDGGRRKGWCD